MHNGAVVLEEIGCPFCGEKRAEPHLPAIVHSNTHGTHRWTVQRCLECDLIFLNPRPTEEASAAFYAGVEYLPFSSASVQRSVISRLYLWLRRYNLGWKRRLMARMLRRRDSSKPSLLDVGCGTGEFLNEMRRAGWEVAGLERDAGAAQFARDTLKLNVVTGAVDELSKINEQFDVITLWHVLEHVYHPKDALVQVARLIRDDGIVLIAVPNIGGVDARIYGQHWIALDAPRHVQHFTVRTLQAMAAGAGLKLVRARQLPLDAFFNTIMSEKMHASRSASTLLLWPLRVARSLLTTCASLLMGSRILFPAGMRGATIVGCFVKSKNKKNV